ncbi:angiotensin-converting enzyme-like [Ostrinia nubilalis]|uniref:angiotensin-converting enzyme-like n=1 Tax=Ostrinia nubilalis TaxID=29057 RepID=UPI0030822745
MGDVGRNSENHRETLNLYDELQSLYSNVEVCIPRQHNSTIINSTDAESAILDYLSTVKNLLKLTDGVTVSAKVAADAELENGGLCFKGEHDFEDMMKGKNEEVLRWIWSLWREKVGGSMKEPYKRLVELENRAAWRSGYTDIGASWRDELEMPNLRKLSRSLYNEIRPFYTLLHGVVRFYLRRQYGDVVPRAGPIPAHLLGNLWSQNWETKLELITSKKLNLDDSIKKLNWTVEHMVKRVEDFYQSMGLPAMTETFWRESVFSKENGNTRCHGTAADMFKPGDFRMMYCTGTTFEDFYVLHHEFGHIQYYMAYENQPGIFKQANTALHESIGDAIMYGVITPQHLNRLGLVNDSILYENSSKSFSKRADSETKHHLGINLEDGRLAKTNDNLENAPWSLSNNLNLESDMHDMREDSKTKVNRLPYLNEFETNEDNLIEGKSKVSFVKTKESDMKEDTIFDATNNFENDLTTDEMLLLRQALNKIPQIPFALVIDEYRWKYFEGSIDKDKFNKEFWDLTLELQGIAPPEERGEEYFDVAAKFHVPDHTPYIRYFLSSFIQHQIFEALCRAAVFGRRDVTADIPGSISLNRCDIYGSKAAGKLLKDLMSRGHSQHWQEILQETTGNTDITADSLKRYYRPLYDVLRRIVQKHQIPLGW